MDTTDIGTKDQPVGDVTYEHHCGASACEQFFGSAWPFTADFPGASSAKPKLVAKILRKMVKILRSKELSEYAL